MLKVENRVTRSQFQVLVLTYLVVIGALLLRYFSLQIYEHEKFKTQAEVNRIRAVPVKAPRGLIFDRSGRLLADNYPIYVLTVTPEQLTDLGALFQRIQAVAGIDSSLLSQNYQHYFQSKYLPVPLARDLSFSQLSALEENRYELPYIHYQKIPSRYYPSPVQLSHVLGYIKEIDQATLSAQLNQGHRYHPGDMIGWKGIEKAYEDYLKGEDGVQYFEVDAFGREVGQYRDRPGEAPAPGHDLFLTIDLDLQRTAERLMQGRAGALLVSDPGTGEILCAVSAPDYSPDLFTGTIREQEWEEVLSDSLKPLLNRLTNGQYPPGSTFKIISALLLLKDHLIDTTQVFHCSGSYHFGDRTFHCWNEYGHGTVNLPKAIIQSCNVYFFNAIQKADLNALAALAKEFGFGSPTGVDLPFESAGIIPTKEYLTAKFGRRGWSTGALLNLAIGQGEILVTPMQMIQFINLVATHGRTPSLHFNRQAHTHWVQGPQLPDSLWKQMETYLQAVVNHEHGTGKLFRSNSDSLWVGGKTGTAENPHGEPHAWFVGIARYHDISRTVVVLIENGGHGGEVAAPIARAIIQQAFTETNLFAER
ncbi:MAG: penicillin-binding protein 2 [Candidatus Neomarinimicrobiota bacterium]|nr:MAG: penicillin-binding protein 2 [Candidatus Neomarinimicrobiota bacterium]